MSVDHEESGRDVEVTNTVRVLFSDLHGIARGRDVPARELDRAAKDGLGFCRAVMGTDLRSTSIVGGEAGFPDLHAMPDLATLAPLPWEPGVSVCLSDLVRAVDGLPEPIDPRGTVRRAVAAFGELGCSAVIGPELEFHLCRVEAGPPPRISRYVDRPSMVYTVGPQADPEGVVRELAGRLDQLGLEVAAVNHEFASSQFEINLRSAPALAAALRGDGSAQGRAAERRAVPLPRSLPESLAALERDASLRQMLGPELIDTFVAIKRSEIERHRAWVSDWEIAEYLQHL